MATRARPSSYLGIIERDRSERRDHAAEQPKRGKGPERPIRVKKGTPGKQQVEKRLARHYEQCKRDNRGRFTSGARLKNYCARVARTIVQQHPKQGGARRRAPSSSSSRPAEGGMIMAKRRLPPRYKSGPKKGQFKPRGSHGGEAKRRRTRARAEEPKRRRRRARAAAPKRASAPRRSRGRRSGKRSTPRTQNIAIAGLAREMREAMGRRRGRRRHARAKEPIRMGIGGAFALAGGGFVGALGANVWHRFANTMSASATNPTLPQNVASIAQYNDYAVDAPPGLMSSAGQIVLSILGFALIMTKWSWLKLFGLGVGLGSLGHWLVQLANGYALEPMLKGTTAGARMYAHDQRAKDAIAGNATQGELGTVGTGDPPPQARDNAISMFGRRGQPAFPKAQPAHRQPAMLAMGSGAQGLGAMAATAGGAARPAAPASAGGTPPGGGGANPPPTGQPGGGSTQPPTGGNGGTKQPPPAPPTGGNGGNVPGTGGGAECSSCLCNPCTCDGAGAGAPPDGDDEMPEVHPWFRQPRRQNNTRRVA